MTSRRRSDRVSLTLLLEASGTDSQGREFKERARTLMISQGGAVILFDRELIPEQRIHIRRQAPAEAHRQSDVRIVREFGRDENGCLYAVEVLNPEVDLWGVEFPTAGDVTEAVARMLLECTYCHCREVVHLSPLELRAFETNRGIARHCKACNVPSIWIQGGHEVEKKATRSGARSQRKDESPGTSPSQGEKRDRQRIRLKARLTACIRQQGADDELAVCEDISPLGMCFRSKRRYGVDTPIDVAVPYAPDAANIFLPARVVYSEELPKAGMFRHGTEYRKIGPQSH